jgi:serine phosphatase RsbU (regulator of sigma subunit)
MSTGKEVSASKLSKNEAVKSKLENAERYISTLRLLFSLFSTVVYVLFVDADPAYTSIAWFVIIFGNGYSIISLIFRPERRFPILRSAYVNTIGDATFTSLWIIATGWMESPFYLIWYLSIVSVAARFTALETAISTVVYLICYAFIFHFDQGSGPEAAQLITRMGFIPLSGILGMYFSNEISDQLRDKLRLAHAETKLQRANEELEERVRERTAELQVMHDDITDSINYANRIQNAILPDGKELAHCFKDCMVVYLPKDIISGDFYWSHRRGDITFVAVVDCTGHGVPGALMSMIGNNLLNQVIIEHGENDPAIILSEMDKGLERLLRRDRIVNSINDGMDMSLCVIDHMTRTITFAGAQQSALFISDGEVSELPSTKLTIGGISTTEHKSFTAKRVHFQQGDRVYLMSDGFQDQFGGPKGKKYYRKNLIDLIRSIQSKRLSEHGGILIDEFRKWQGEEMQMDDVTVIGVEL